MSTSPAERIIRIEEWELPVLAEPLFQDRELLIANYWCFHPRFRFLKSAPRAARLLDVGAGSGGLWYWLEWESPRRTDLRLFAVDLNKGQLFDRYEGYQVGDLDEVALDHTDSSLDAALASHVLEHVRDERRMLSELRRVLRDGGLAYIEVPTPRSMSLPKRSRFHDLGLEVSTVNFFDDDTHLRTFSLRELGESLRETGFEVLESGQIRNHFLEDELLTWGFREKDEEVATYGVWSKMGFAHYVVARAGAR